MPYAIRWSFRWNPKVIVIAFLRAWKGRQKGLTIPTYRLVGVQLGKEEGDGRRLYLGCRTFMWRSERGEIIIPLDVFP